MLTVAIIAYVLSVALIDHFTPMSTQRNYIALVPMCSILSAQLVYLLHVYKPALRFPLMVIFAALAIFDVFHSLQAVRAKRAPVADWKGAAQFIVDHKGESSVYYVTNSEFNKWRALTSRFYIERLSGGGIDAKPFVPGKTKLPNQALIFFAQYPFVDSFEKAMIDAGAHEVFAAKPLHDPFSTAVFYNKQIPKGDQ